MFEKALFDLSASINLMSWSIFKKLKLGEALPTVTYLAIGGSIPHLSTRYHRGCLVKVEKFIFPTNFIILDMEEDKEVPIILRRPFLSMGRVLIDV